jgi:hypothetical protein
MDKNLDETWGGKFRVQKWLWLGAEFYTVIHSDRLSDIDSHVSCPQQNMAGASDGSV